MNKIILLAIIFNGIYLSLKKDWITHSLLTLITKYIKDYPIISILSFILLFTIIYLIKKKFSIKKRIIIIDIEKIEKEYKIKNDNVKKENINIQISESVNNEIKFNEENSSQRVNITKSIKNSNTNNDINKIDQEKLSAKESETYKNKIETNYQNIDSIEIYEISNEINKQILLIKSYENTLNQKISNIYFNHRLDEIKSQILKMLPIFKYFNNIRSLLLCHKYVNSVIANEVENNKFLRISNKYFLNDLIGFKISDEKQKKMYISQFIVQIKDYLLPKNQYNLMLDFLYFLKDYLNNIHYVYKNKDLTDNIYFQKVFNNEYSPDNIIINNIDNSNLVNDNNVYRNQLENTQKNNNERNNVLERQPDLNIKNNIFSILLKNIENITNDIENIMNIDENDEDLTFQIRNELEDFDFFLSNNDKIGLKQDINFSLHNIEESSSSSKNFEKLFFDFFYKKDNIQIDCSNLLSKTKKKIEDKYSYIINKLNNYELIYDKIINEMSNLDTNMDSKFRKKIKYVNDAKKNTNKLKKSLLHLNELTMKYYDSLIIANFLKLKVKEIEKKLMTEKNVFTFEELFKEWKKRFSQDYTKSLKNKFFIDEAFTQVQLYDEKQYKILTHDIEYLKSSKEYLKFIDENALNNIGPKQMIDNIDKIANGTKIDIFGIDKEIDYSKLKKLEEEKN